MPKRVEGTGNPSPDLMIIGEAPGKNEDEQGIPFIGVSGQMLNEILFKCGIRRSEVYITNVCKYRPPLNDFSKLHIIGIDIEKEIRDLWEFEIKVLKPKCILAVGNEALKALTGNDGILNWRGSILLANDGVTKVVPCIHPAALFSHSGEEGKSKGGLEWTYLKLIEADIARAVEESRTREINLPARDLTIAHNSLDVFRFFRQYEKLDKCVVDIESINCVPVCVGFAFNSHHAISIPLLRSIGQHKLTDMGDNEMDECWREVDRQLRRLKLIGHNLKYDDYKMGLIGFEMPQIYSDTLLKIRVIFPELPDKRLCTLSSLWTREPFYKDDGKEFKLGKSNISQLLRYNGQDCAVNYEVDEALDKDLVSLSEQYKVPLVSYFYDYIMKKHKLYLKMENTGFLVDVPRQKELKKKYTEMKDTTHEKLIELIGHEINVKSYPQMCDLLYKEMKFRFMKRDPTSEDTIVRLMGNHAKKKEHKEILEAVLEERRIRDQLSRQINFSPDYDGRCKTVYNISSTETCRSSTGILKKPIRPKKVGLAFHTISSHGRLAKDIKSMLICDPSKVFIKVDSSQAEARIVAVLSQDWELLEAFDKVDIHRRTAGLLFGYTTKLELGADYHNPLIDEMGKDSPERFTGKLCRHAGNYSMQKGRLMTEFNTLAQKFDIRMDISEWRAGKLLEMFHSASPKLKGIFHKDIQDVINSTRTLIDPYGGVRQFFGRMDEELYKEAYANLPQRTVAHLIQKAALVADEKFNGEAQFIAEIHDAILIQVPENNWEPFAKVIKEEMEKEIDFSQYCSLKRDYKLKIPADVEISNTNYGDFKKVKL